MTKIGQRIASRGRNVTVITWANRRKVSGLKITLNQMCCPLRNYYCHICFNQQL